MVGPSELLSVISSWKYAGACASLKGTLTYSYLPNSDVNNVLGIESVVSLIWWYPALKS